MTSWCSTILAVSATSDSELQVQSVLEENKALVYWGEKIQSSMKHKEAEVKSNAWSTFYIWTSSCPEASCDSSSAVKTLNTEMPTLPSTWKQSCPFAPGQVWQPDVYVNQWRLESPLLCTFMVTGLTGSAVQLFFIGHFTQIKLYILELNGNVLLFRVYVTDGSLQRRV